MGVTENLEQLCDLVVKLGANDAKVINADQVVVNN